MAGIEKVCQYSLEYGGYEIYKWKRCHIQVKPEYRKQFNGANHTLHVFKKPTRVKCPVLGVVFTPDENDKDNDIFNMVESPSLEYVLEVHNDKLLGDVSGLYVNHVQFHGIKTPNTKLEKIGGEHYRVILNRRLIPYGKNEKLTTVYRKLKRMLKCKKLNIVKHNTTLEYWLRIKQTQGDVANATNTK